MLEKFYESLSRIFSAEDFVFDKRDQSYHVSSVYVGDGRRVHKVLLRGNTRRLFVFKIKPSYDTKVIFITTKNLGVYLQNKKAIFWRNIYQLGKIRTRGSRNKDVLNFTKKDLL